MNTRLYRRSGLYRSLFCIERNERNAHRSSQRYKHLCEKTMAISAEIALDHYKSAMESGDYSAALVWQEQYFSFANTLREWDRYDLISFEEYGKVNKGHR